MAGSGPQKENGYTAIANEIMERLAVTPLTGGEFRCLLLLLRKTYGWNKKEDKISLSQWAKDVGMKRQNVWSILQSLLKRNMIYTKVDGPKRAATWGFNKHFNEWVLESVMPQHDSSVMPENDSSEKSVMLDHDSSKSPVMPQHDKSVIPPHESTKDNKSNSAAAVIEDESGDSATALVLLAYQAVCAFPPSMTSDKGRANVLTAFQLIDRFSYPTCIRALSTLKERQNAMFIKNSRDRIKAPLGYLRTILEEDHAAPVASTAPTTVNFALEEIL